MTEIIRSAIISDCQRYRYLLSRSWEPSCWSLPFVMLNPSTADADIDDPTIRRCMGFARRERFGGITVCNLYAFRATKPRDLFSVEDPCGPENTRWLHDVARSASFSGTPIVCAWGAQGVNGEATTALFRIHGASLVCLGKTAGGHPRHPLYVRNDQPLEPFS